MNKIFLTGNLTKAPELKYTQSGKAYLKVGIAVQRGIEKDKVDFFDLVAWEHTAKFISNYFKKGSRIIVIGRLQTNNYTDTSGVKRYGVEVIVESVEFGGGKKEETAKPAESSSGFDDDFVGDEISDDSVPF